MKILFRTILVSAILWFNLAPPAICAPIEKARQSELTILMLNDVYQQSPVEKGMRGGLARVATMRNEIVATHPNTLFLFAGDTLSPSVASNTFKGKQMIAAWNALGIDYATPGNHEFDFGPDVLIQRINDSKFKWICANLIDKRTGTSFDNIDRYVIRDIGGIKVGIFGLITQDTLQSSITGPNVDILDPCQTARSVVGEMRKQGAKVIIALTHLTMSKDKEIARCVPIDVIVGGHEHNVLQTVAAGAAILKAGSDAVNLGRIDITFSNPKQSVESVDWQLLPVTSAIPDDPAVAAVVSSYENQLKTTLDVPVGQTTVVLDATQLSNQTKETNLSDFIADAYRADNGAQIALFNGGSVRSNTIYELGKLTRRDVLSILPFENPIVKVQVPGATIRKALEHGLALVGTRDSGRFPQVSGMTYTYDARKPAGARLIEVLVEGSALNDQQDYTLTTNAFITRGGDGYDMFKDARYLVDEEGGNSESVALLNAITKAKAICPHVQGRIKRLDLEQ